MHKMSWSDEFNVFVIIKLFINKHDHNIKSHMFKDESRE